MNNQDLQNKYDEMHKQGSAAWFSDGREERETILKMGEPWDRKFVLEIGCGEGDLSSMIMKNRAYDVLGVDYSEQAVKRAIEKHGVEENDDVDCTKFENKNYKDIGDLFDCLVMQGVLEHLDDPFGELQWMIEHFKPKTVITSSPCFLNPRGIVWMTLDMLGAVMSKTDLHYLNPWEFEEFCDEHDYRLKMEQCDKSWGNGVDMISDLYQRIPLALKDGGLKGDPYKLLDFLSRYPVDGYGATMVYRIEV